jgi:glycosyltransferase involved in cell wall biosynthesis
MLSLIIPTHAARAHSLSRVLAALRAQTLPADCFEVIVSLDGEGAGPAPGGWPFALRVARGPRGGPGAARNRGAALAHGARLLFLDDDILPAPGCLAAHLDGTPRHDPDPVTVVLGRITLPPPRARTPWERYLTARYDEHFVKLARPGYAPSFWDCLSGSLSLPRALFERAGGFDPAFTRHEDVELGLRLAEAGARFVYAPAAVAEHQYSRGLDAGLADALGEGESAGVLIRRHPALAPNFIHARWRRYGPLARLALRRALADAARHAAALAAARAGLARVDASPLPYLARRPAYQWAYHLNFWAGLRRTAPEWLP